MSKLVSNTVLKAGLAGAAGAFVADSFSDDVGKMVNVEPGSIWETVVKAGLAAVTTAVIIKYA